MSSHRNKFIATGVLAWLGGLATAFAVVSCDTETCMDPEDPACHPGPLVAADEREAITSTPGECDMVGHPSIHVVPVLHRDDVLLPVRVDSVWFTHEGKTYEAHCVHDGSDCTGGWIAGYELEGPITVGTEYCDTTVEQTVTIERTPDGCHVQTQFLALEVTTRGCLTAETVPVAPPPPPWATVAGLAPG